MKSIQEEQEDFIAAYNAIEDPLLQYDMLISLYGTLPRLPPEEKSDSNLVQGCTSKLWLVCRYVDGRIRIGMESEALIVGGIAAVLVHLLNDRTPAEILETELTFIERTALHTELSSDRRHGMRRIIDHIQSFAKGAVTGGI